MCLIHEVVLYAMLYGTVPFKAQNMPDLHKLILKAKYTLKDDISEEARSLVKCLLERDPTKRFNVSEVLDHPWMQEIDEERKILVFKAQWTFLTRMKLRSFARSSRTTTPAGTIAIQRKRPTKREEVSLNKNLTRLRTSF